MEEVYYRKREQETTTTKTTMSALPRRIIKETQRLMQEPVPGISAVPDESNARYFHVIVTGPEDSPFEGGLFKLELFLPEGKCRKIQLLKSHVRNSF